MGNSESQSKFGHMFVRTEKPYYFSGEQVHGMVYLNIIQSGFPGNTLFMKVKGKEITKWAETKDNTVRTEEQQTVTYHETINHNGHNFFFRQKFQLHSFRGQHLEAGQYAFPFQFFLNNGIPGSFDEHNPDYKAQIKYKIKAEISSFQDNKIKIKHHQELIVREPVHEVVQTNLKGEMCVKVRTWCCFNQGESIIKCTFEKNQYTPGETARLWVEIDNSNCNMEISEIKAILNRRVTLRSDFNQYKTISSELLSLRITGVPPRSYATNEHRKHMDLLLINLLKPSTNGILVRCDYTLTATAVLKGCICCTSDPYAPIPLAYDQVPVIQNWNPQTFEPVLFKFSEQTHDTQMISDDVSQKQTIGKNENIGSMNQNTMV